MPPALRGALKFNRNIDQGEAHVDLRSDLSQKQIILEVCEVSTKQAEECVE